MGAEFARGEAPIVRNAGSAFWRAREKGIQAVDPHPDEFGCVYLPRVPTVGPPVPRVPDGPAWCASGVLGLRRNAVDFSWSISGRVTG